jgi:SAM-dependent methyltransferase
MGNSNTSYNPERYWGDVARHISSRGEANVLAGDDAPFFRYRRGKFVAEFLSHMDVTGRDVLELGCGPGGNIAELAKLSPRRLVGADISEQMVELARRNTGCEIVKTNTGLPFGDSTFDLAFTVTVLQHNMDDTVGHLLREMARISRNSVVLCEDTFPVRRERYSYIRRPTAFYVRALAPHGFHLVERRFLRDRLSGFCSSIVRKTLNPGTNEGAAKRPFSTRMERAAVRIFGPLDRFAALPTGLTMLRFMRN